MAATPSSQNFYFRIAFQYPPLSAPTRSIKPFCLSLEIFDLTFLKFVLPL
jgi:hypothetical protein